MKKFLVVVTLLMVTVAFAMPAFAVDAPKAEVAKEVKAEAPKAEAAKDAKPEVKMAEFVGKFVKVTDGKKERIEFVTDKGEKYFIPAKDQKFVEIAKIADFDKKSFEVKGTVRPAPKAKPNLLPALTIAEYKEAAAVEAAPAAPATTEVKKEETKPAEAPKAEETKKEEVKPAEEKK